MKTINVKNIYEYLRERNQKLVLKTPVKITYHKPCNLDNFENIKWLLLNTNNLEYVEMKAYDKCCGLNLLTNFSQREIVSEISKSKYDNIVNANVKIVATSCFGCEIALNSYSKGKYKTVDLLDLLAEYS